MVTINNSMAKFKGFSTVDRVRAPYTLVDSDLVKRDLLNEFYTRRGERVMRPEFGSIIWDIVMDPSTSKLEGQIRDDVKKILGRDPRVEHKNTAVYVLDHAIRVEILIEILPAGDVEQLYLEYTREITEGIE